MLFSFISCREPKYKLSENNWKKYSLEKPDELIINEFKNHDIIFLGETHRKRNDLKFLQSLIPVLHKNGINILFFEFASYEDNLRIDSVLTANKYDEEIVKSIIHDNFWEWPYQEYLDIFKAAWEVNQKSSKKKFKIYGIANANSKPPGLAMREWTEKDWANLIVNAAIHKNKKALVFCGNNHSITKYVQPFVADGKFKKFNSRERVGQYVYDIVGAKAMTIWIHFPWGNSYYDPSYSPLVRYLDSISLLLKKPFAFETRKSELGELVDSVSVYSMGYSKIKLKEIVDAYVVLSPTCKDDFVTFVPHFNTNANIENTNSQISFFYKYKPFTVRQANDTLKKWYIKDSLEFYDFRKKLNCR
jgi:hypothetical protein